MKRRMVRLGLTGYPLSHSLSPRLHAAALAALGLKGEYRLYPVAPEDPDGLRRLTERLRRGELHGLNVTIPHKQTVIPLLDELSPAARSIGAVNTICLRDGRLVGENTDAPGFWTDVNRLFSSSKAPPSVERGEGLEGSALVLGAGGAARAVVYALLTHGWRVALAVRRADLDQAAALIRSMEAFAGSGSPAPILLEAEALAPHLGGVGLIVNATPLGMFPEVDACPWPDGLPFPPAARLYDLVYNPRETLLIRRARRAGLPAATGLGMLVEQAAHSFEIWTGQVPSREAMFAAVEEG